MACSVAVAAKDAGERVCVIDMDPQASLVSWSKTRERDDIVVIAANGEELPALLGALERRGTTLAIIDTPGADGGASTVAMRAADLNVIPSRPSIFDLWASAQTCAALKAANRDFAFMLNQCPPVQQSARVQNAVAALEEIGGLISPLVATRVDFQDAARRGLGVTEVNPNGGAAQEIRALWESLKRRVARGEALAPASEAA